MKLASDAGHRVVLVVATGGEEGEYPEGFILHPDELKSVRRQELEESAAILGVAQIHMLGYRDSGMMGTAANEDDRCFFKSEVDIAAEKLASILREEQADVLTIYDENGGYGHPDHIMVNRVGKKAAEIADVPNVFEATMNRDRFMELMKTEMSEMQERAVTEDQLDFNPDSLGMPASAINTEIDVASVIRAKRAALAKHQSQSMGTAFVSDMSDRLFQLAFGVESFIGRGPGGKITRRSIF